MALVAVFVTAGVLASLTGARTAAEVPGALVYLAIALGSYAGGLQLYVDRRTTLHTAKFWHPFTVAGLRSAAPWWLSAALALSASWALDSA
ncbi:hypothetical protein [Aquipuribacter hungaricus]|uniref:hypothetical protein n=1 Tax=Aquipuribacter hungaricus TaxID=545624 RepID=UPI0030EF5F8C